MDLSAAAPGAGPLVYPPLLRRWDGGAVKIDGTVARGRRGRGVRVHPLPRPRPRPDRPLARERPRGAGQRRHLPDRLGRGWANRCPTGEASVPHPAWAWDHAKAKESVRKLAALDPAGRRRRPRASRCAARACARRWNARPRSTEPVVSGPAMLGTYASAALICAASLLVGRAVLSLAGRSEWSWLEPAVGFGAVLTVTGAAGAGAGHGTTATLGRAALLVARRRGVVSAAALRGAPGALRAGLPVAIVVGLVLAIPFAVSGRWGLLGVGFNNDLGLHLAWAEWLRSGFGPTAGRRLPARPARAGGRDRRGAGDRRSARPSSARSSRSASSPGLTALAALRRARRRRAARSPRRWSRSPTWPPPTSPRAPSRRRPRRSSSSPSRSPCATRRGPMPTGRLLGRRLRLLPPLPGPGRRHLLLLQLRRARLAGRDRRALEPDPARRCAGRWRRARCCASCCARDPGRRSRSSPALGGRSPLVGPFGFAGGFNKVAGSNTYGPVSPVETLGIWPASNYRLDAAGGAHLTGLAGAIAALALVARRRLVGAGAASWRSRSRSRACAALYLVSLPFSGDYSQAKALMIAAPLAMLVAIRPLLRARHRRPPTSLRRLGLGGAGGRLRRRRALLELPRPARRAGRAARATAPSCSAFLPILHGQPVLYAGQDRYAAYELLGADTHVPLVEFPDDGRLARTSRSRSTPATPTARSTSTPSRRATLERLPLRRSPAAPPGTAKRPPNFRRDRRHPLLRALGTDRPDPRQTATSCSRGPRPAALADCAAPEIRILTRQPGPRLALPRRRDRPQSGLARGQRPRHRRARLAGARPAGRRAGTSRSSTSPPST